MTIEQTRMQREHVWREILQDQVSRHWLNLFIRIFLRSRAGGFGATAPGPFAIRFLPGIGHRTRNL